MRTWCEPTMIPNGLYLVQLTSDTGSGWISQKDTSSCCTAGGSVTSCCPRLTLRSSCLDGTNQRINVTGFNGITWDTRSTPYNPQDPTSTFTFMNSLGLSIGPSPPPIPSASRIQYPFEQLGSYVHSFEVRVNNAGGLVAPPARHRHASAYSNDDLLVDQYGADGIFLVYGGTTEARLDQRVTSSSSLLDDLWIFVISNHTWAQINVTGSIAPPPLHGASMTSIGSTFFLAGGEYYSSSLKAWVVDPTVYSIDISLPSYKIQWRVLPSSPSSLASSSSPNNGVTSSLRVAASNSQLALHTQFGLLFTPVPARLTFGAEASTSNSSNATTSSSIQLKLQTLSDGDTAVMSGISSISINKGGAPLYPRGAVFLQGQASRGGVLVPPTFLPPGGGGGGGGGRRREEEEACEPRQ